MTTRAKIRQSDHLARWASSEIATRSVISGNEFADNLFGGISAATGLVACIAGVATYMKLREPRDKSERSTQLQELQTEYGRRHSRVEQRLEEELERLQKERERPSDATRQIDAERRQSMEGSTS